MNRMNPTISTTTTAIRKITNPAENKPAFGTGVLDPKGIDIIKDKIKDANATTVTIGMITDIRLEIKPKLFADSSDKQTPQTYLALFLDKVFACLEVLNAALRAS